MDCRLTRRSALRLGAGAAALGALRLPSPAFAATRGPELFELPVPDGAAHAAGAGWRTTAVLPAPRRFDLVGLKWARGGRPQAAGAPPRGRGGRGPLGSPRPRAPAPDGERGPAGTDPAFTGAADEL